MNSTYKDILDAFFKMTLENSINDSMMEFSYSFPYDGMKEYALEICAIPFSEFLEYIKTNGDDSCILPDAVSQFSNLRDCSVGFCEATDNMRRPLTLEEIGERLQDDGIDRNSVANIKYGENHAKMALHFGLAQCRYNSWYISALGKIFTLLPKEKQDALMIRTLLRNKLYSFVFTKLESQNVSIETILKTIDLSTSTRTRRLSSVKKILSWYLNVLSNERVVFNHRIIELSPIDHINHNRLPIHLERRNHIPKLKKGTYKEKYLHLITSIPSLSLEEERNLFKRYIAGKQASQIA